jgi:hypothetical protein
MPMKGFGTPFQRPLTAEDIAEIEEGMNMLICDLFPPGEKREDALQMDLPDKIDAYIGIAEHAENDPHLKDVVAGTGLREGMCELLKAVKEYYHKLN